MGAPIPCLEDGCFNKAAWDGKGRCVKHKRPAFKGSNRSQRLPADWATRRRLVIARDKGICYVCGKDGADNADHVIAGDDHSMENLKAIHQNTEPFCHRYKTAQEGVAAAWAQKPTWKRF